MDFCTECQALYTKNITPDDKIIFQCNSCGNRVAGTASDTLLESEFVDALLADAIFDQTIQNAPFDPAANTYERECPKCHMPYMTKIRVGALQTTRLVCVCGHIENY